MIRIKTKTSGAGFDGVATRKITEKEYRRAMFKSVTLGETTIAGLAPVGATAHLRQGIVGKVKSPFQGVVGIAGPASKYGDIRERGRRPGRFPPPDAIEYWLQRSNRGKAFVASIAADYDLKPAAALKAATFLKSRGIARHGYRGAWMFKKGEKRIRPKVLKFFRNATDRLARQM